MDHKTTSLVRRGHLTCHCLLVETPTELILLDTGFGIQDVRRPKERLSQFFLNLVSPDFREEMTAIRQIQKLGFQPHDVRHIIMTHLDFDHAGGLDDFPEAVVHMLQDERDYAFSQKTWLDRQRFRPQQWNYRQNWKVYSVAQGESWFGFDQVKNLEGIPPEVVMIPLMGHTFGHAGIAVKTESDWKFLAGDAYFFHAEMNAEHPYCTPGLRLYQFMLEKDRRARINNQIRLRKLKKNHSQEVTLFCSHDVLEFERTAQRSTEIPIEKILMREGQSA